MKTMVRTVEAEIDEQGNVRLLEAIQLSSVRRALVTILEDGEGDTFDTALVSEAALASDWNKPKEVQAWSHLQPER